MLVLVCLLVQNTNEQECPALAVVGNKLDLDSHRQVPSHLGEEVARKANATFGEVSAKTGEGIEVVSNICIGSINCNEVTV